MNRTPRYCRVVDRVDLADAPRLAHVGAAGQHAAIHERLDAAQPQHVVVLVQRMRRGLANRRFDPVERRLSVDAVGHERAARERVLLEQRAVELELAARLGIGVDDAGDADRVVVGQQLAQPREPVGVGRRGPARLRPDVARAVAQDARRLAVPVALDAAGLRPPAPGTSRRCRSSTAPLSSATRPGPVRKATGCSGAARSSSARVG